MQQTLRETFFWDTLYIFAPMSQQKMRRCFKSFDLLKKLLIFSHFGNHYCGVWLIVHHQFGKLPSSAQAQAQSRLGAEIALISSNTPHPPGRRQLKAQTDYVH